MPSTLRPTEGDKRQSGARRALAAVLLQKQPRLWSRFLTLYIRLQRLPRGWRRRLARKTAVSLAGAALLLALGRTPAAHAETIEVDNGQVAVANDGLCSLHEAIISANNNNAPFDTTGECKDGSGADTIILPEGGQFYISQYFGYEYLSETALPLISSEITIEGNGSIIKRTAGLADEFRIMAVSSSGNLTLNNTIISHGEAIGMSGGGIISYGTLTINHSTFNNNVGNPYGGGGAIKHGGYYIYYSRPASGPLQINYSAFNDNNGEGDGGAVYHNGSELTIRGSSFSGNSARKGGAIYSYSSTTSNDNTNIYHSTFDDNSARDGGAIFNYDTPLNVVNSTFSGNRANQEGGAIYSEFSPVTITNSSFSSNTANNKGGAIYHDEGTLTLNRNLISGNSAPYGAEIFNDDIVIANNYNLFGHDGLTTTAALDGVTPGANDITATSDSATAKPLTDILQMNLGTNGGPASGALGTEQPMLTLALISGSPAIDAAPSAACTAAPVGGVDQRGYLRNVNGSSSSSTNECDIGAYEVQPPALYMTAAGPGTADGVAFGKEDILVWNGAEWSKHFDGTDAGLTNKHDLNAIHVNGEDDIYLSFFQNKIKTTNLGKVFGHDILHYDGSDFSLYFDGSDVGLTTTAEKIDALHILDDGTGLPGGGSCEAYLLISTLGTGKVPAAGGGNLKFQGEDILGFCASSTGADTAGGWYMVLDGSAEGMPKNSTDSISASEDGSIIYLTTQAAFNVDSASGGHSVVYKFENGDFSGPLFSAPANDLNQKVDGLHVAGIIPEETIP